MTSETRGCSGQCASICCSTRAVVDLPTATEPASPMTNGVRGGCGWCRNSSVAAVELGRGLHVEAEQARQRQVDLLHLVEVQLVPEAADAVDLLGGQRLLGGTARAAQASRSSSTYGELSLGCAPLDMRATLDLRGPEGPWFSAANAGSQRVGNALD